MLPSSTQLQERPCCSYGSDIQIASMRCVFCGGPFCYPTAYDRVTASLTASSSSSSFRWLSSYYSLQADANKRKRGEPPAFYTHKDCQRFLEQQLEMSLSHSHVWPSVRQYKGPKDGMPDGLPPSSYLGIAELVQPHARSSTTILSQNFTAEYSWMLQSPLVCTRNAARVLSIWQPKLDLRPRSLAMRMASLMTTSNRSFRVRVMLSCRISGLP